MNQSDKNSTDQNDKYNSWKTFGYASGATLAGSLAILTSVYAAYYNNTIYKLSIDTEGRLSSVKSGFNVETKDLNDKIAEIEVKNNGFKAFYDFQEKFPKVVKDIEDRYGSTGLNKRFAFITEDPKGVEFYTLSEVQAFVEKGDVKMLGRILKANGTPPYTTTDSNFIEGFKNQIALSDSEVLTLGQNACGMSKINSLARKYVEKYVEENQIFAFKDKKTGILFFKKSNDVKDIEDIEGILGEDLTIASGTKINDAVSWQEKFANKSDFVKNLQQKYAEVLDLTKQRIVPSLTDPASPKLAPYDILTSNIPTDITLVNYKKYLNTIFNSQTPLIPIKTPESFKNLCNLLRLKNATHSLCKIDEAGTTATFSSSDGKTTFGVIKWDPATSKVSGLDTVEISNNSTYVPSNITDGKLGGFNPYSRPFTLTKDYVAYTTIPVAPATKAVEVKLSDFMDAKVFPLGDIKSSDDYSKQVATLFGGPKPTIPIDSKEKLTAFAKFLGDKSGSEHELIDDSGKVSGISFTDIKGTVIGKLTVTEVTIGGKINYQIDGLNAEYKPASSTTKEVNGLQLKQWQNTPDAQGYILKNSKTLSFESGYELQKVNPAEISIDKTYTFQIWFCIGAAVALMGLFGLLCRAAYVRSKKNEDLDLLNENINDAQFTAALEQRKKDLDKVKQTLENLNQESEQQQITKICIDIKKANKEKKKLEQEINEIKQLSYLSFFDSTQDSKDRIVKLLDGKPLIEITPEVINAKLAEKQQQLTNKQKVLGENIDRLKKMDFIKNILDNNFAADLGTDDKGLREFRNALDLAIVQQSAQGIKEAVDNINMAKNGIERQLIDIAKQQTQLKHPDTLLALDTFFEVRSKFQTKELMEQEHKKSLHLRDMMDRNGVNNITKLSEVKDIINKKSFLTK